MRERNRSQAVSAGGKNALIGMSMDSGMVVVLRRGEEADFDDIKIR